MFRPHSILQRMGNVSSSFTGIIAHLKDPSIKLYFYFWSFLLCNYAFVSMLVSLYLWNLLFAYFLSLTHSNSQTLHFFSTYKWIKEIWNTFQDFYFKRISGKCLLRDIMQGSLSFNHNYLESSKPSLCRNRNYSLINRNSFLFFWRSCSLPRWMLKWFPSVWESDDSRMGDVPSSFLLGGICFVLPFENLKEKSLWFPSVWESGDSRMGDVPSSFLLGGICLILPIANRAVLEWDLIHPHSGLGEMSHPPFAFLGWSLFHPTLRPTERHRPQPGLLYPRGGRRNLGLKDSRTDIA